jgi:[acyl-carrier-protein] S-malonyltransferase
MREVWVFPGQGSQKPGMGRDLCERWAVARDTFAQASEALGLDMAALCFDDAERLARTEFQQPAILTVEVAMARVLEREFGLRPERTGGHSLGEYAALVTAGVMDLGGAARLVRERGRLMQEAVPAGRGAMAAVIRAELDADALAAELAGIDVDIANHNAADQVVLSGTAEAVDAAAERLRAAAVRTRVLPLRVSAPFHSRLMEPARLAFAPVLSEASADWDVTGAPSVACNASGAFHAADRAAVAEALDRQVTAPVRWMDNMRALTDGPCRVLELGPGRPLRGFFASIGVPITSASTADALEEAARP